MTLALRVTEKPFSSLRRVQTTMEEKMSVIITSPRGVRASWDEGLFDAVCLSHYTMAGEGQLSAADRVVLVVRALRMWPDNAVTTMVDRVLMIDDTVAASGAGAVLAMLAERDLDKLLVDALFRPILLASTLRQYTEDEVDRLIAAVAAAGMDPRVFGLRE